MIYYNTGDVLFQINSDYSYEIKYVDIERMKNHLWHFYIWKYLKTARYLFKKSNLQNEKNILVFFEAKNIFDQISNILC